MDSACFAKPTPAARSFLTRDGTPATVKRRQRVVASGSRVVFIAGTQATVGECKRAFIRSRAAEPFSGRTEFRRQVGELEVPGRRTEAFGRMGATSVASAAAEVEARNSTSTPGVPVLISGIPGKMGIAVAEAAVKAGLQLVPWALSGPGVQRQLIEISGCEPPLETFPSEDRDGVLDRALEQYPELVIVDFTLPAAVNGNAEFYCKRQVPFVMGTTGGDRTQLMNDVQSAGLYAVIAPQMGKQVVAFIAAMEALAESCPGAFAGYALKVTESHQSTKVDTSGTAKEVVACFQRLGVAFSTDQIEMVREPQQQMGRMKVPEEHLKGHAFHTYRLVSPDGTVSFEFQHNICGRSIYAEGTVDAVLFLHSKIAERAEKKLYNMVDVLRGGRMR